MASIANDLFFDTGSAVVVRRVGANVGNVLASERRIQPVDVGQRRI